MNHCLIIDKTTPFCFKCCIVLLIGIRHEVFCLHRDTHSHSETDGNAVFLLLSGRCRVKIKFSSVYLLLRAFHQLLDFSFRTLPGFFTHELCEAIYSTDIGRTKRQNVQCLMPEAKHPQRMIMTRKEKK